MSESPELAEASASFLPRPITALSARPARRYSDFPCSRQAPHYQAISFNSCFPRRNRPTPSALFHLACE